MNRRTLLSLVALLGATFSASRAQMPDAEMKEAMNPQTGTPVKVVARRVPKFTPGKGLKDLVNGAKKGVEKGAAKATPAK